MFLYFTAGETVKLRFIISISVVLLTVALSNATLLAQGLQSERAIDVIVGSDVTTVQENALSDERRIVAAIENSSATASEVRRKFSLDHVEIIFLQDLGEGDTSIETKVEENQLELAGLREAIQGSAMFYHAIDSRSIMLDRIVALEFDDKNGVTIFVAGEKPPTLQAE